MIATTDDPSDRILQTYVPILPKHIWGEARRTRRSATPTFDADRSSGPGPYQAVEWKTGQFVRFERNPNYWGNAGLRRRGRHPVSSRPPDTMVQALKAGELDYARGVDADQFDALQTEPDIVTVDGSRQRLDPARVQHLRHRHRQDDRGRRTVDAGAPRPGVPRRARLCHRQRDARRHASSAATASSGNTIVPPSSRAVARRAGQPAHLRHRAGQAEARRRRLRARRRRQAARQGRQADQPAADCAGLRGRATPTRAQFIQGWFGELGIEVDAAGARRRRRSARSILPPEAGDGDGRLRHRHLGLGRRRRPDVAAEIFTSDAIGNSSDSLYCNPAYDELFDSSSRRPTTTQRKAIIDEMQQIFYDEAPYHILYYDADLHAYRTDQFAGWKNQPPTTARRSSATATLELHAADRRRRPPPRRARRRRPAAPAAPAAPAPSGSRRTAATTRQRQHAAAHRRGRGSSCVVVVGGSVARTPAARTASDDEEDVAIRERPASGRPLAGRPPEPATARWAASTSLRRVRQAIVTIVAIVLLNFVLFRMMPGSPERILLPQPEPDPGQIVAGPRAVGPGQAALPGPVRRLHRRRRCQGDLGYSFKYRGQPVTDVIASGSGRRSSCSGWARSSRSSSAWRWAPTRAGDAAGRSTTSATASR